LTLDLRPLVTGTDKDQARQKIAVALQYELGTDAAPRLTAKGTGDVAEKIVEIAQAAGVHVEHNDPLAQSLSRLELDQQIPKELYRAVAEVIGFILRRAAVHHGAKRHRK
jgi:flagellar biosynthesis protein